MYILEKVTFHTIDMTTQTDFDDSLTELFKKPGAELVHISTELEQGHKPGYGKVHYIATVKIVS